MFNTDANNLGILKVLKLNLTNFIKIHIQL
jgi:hypothetical protein